MMAKEIAALLNLPLTTVNWRIHSLQLAAPYTTSDVERIRNFSSIPASEKKQDSSGNKQHFFYTFAAKYIYNKYGEKGYRDQKREYNRLRYRETVIKPQSMEEFVEKCIDENYESKLKTPKIKVNIPNAKTKANSIKAQSLKYWQFDPTGVFDDELIEFYDWVKKSIGKGYSSSYKKALARNNIMRAHHAIDEDEYWKLMDRYFQFKFSEN